MTLCDGPSIVRRASAIGVAALTVVAHAANAQTADRPDTKVGDQWKLAVYYTVPSTTPNRTWLITSVSAAGIEGTENGETLRLTHELNVIESPHGKVTVPAGDFDAFKLTSRESLSGTSPIGSQYAGETTRTYWYAPAAHAIVKSLSHNPYLGPSTVELVAFELNP
jgi:hypothetical protein